LDSGQLELQKGQEKMLPQMKEMFDTIKAWVSNAGGSKGGSAGGEGEGESSHHDKGKGPF
jgi:hypothetical protein